MQSFIYSPFGSAQDRDFELAIYCTILIVPGTTRDYKNRNSSGLNQKRYSKKGKEALFLRLQKSTVKTLPRNPVFINTPIITLICITLKISGKLTLLQSISSHLHHPENIREIDSFAVNFSDCSNETNNESDDGGNNNANCVTKLHSVILYMPIFISRPSILYPRCLY